MNTSDREQKLTVRFPAGTLEDLREMAQEDTRSLNSEIIWIIRVAIDRRKKERTKQGGSV